MKYGTRIVYTEEQKAVIWERWQKGDSIRSIARLFDLMMRITGMAEKLNKGS